MEGVEGQQPMILPSAVLRSRVALALLSALALAAALPAAARAQARSELADRSTLRVCGDPNNLPYSNDKGEGFENKIADIVAQELHVPVQYTWFPQTFGFVRKTLGADRCDVIIGMATTSDLVQGTNPYYRSTYVLVHRPDLKLPSGDLSDPVFQTLRLGVQPEMPTASIAARYGLLQNAKTYRFLVDTRIEKPAKAMIEDVEKGEIDVALTWGPLGGYWAKTIDPSLVVEPLKGGMGPLERTDYMISMGVRRGEDDWKHTLNRIIAKRKDDIDAVLMSYGVPLLDQQGKLIQPKKSDAGAALPAEPAGYRMDHYHAAVPQTLKGACVVDLKDLQALAKRKDVVLIDVSPAARKPDDRPKDALWTVPKRKTIEGALWMANMGLGELPKPDEAAFQAELTRLAGPDGNRTLVFFCKPDCWMSWNAAKRALSYGLRNVDWFPGGAEAWIDAGLPSETAKPWRP